MEFLRFAVLVGTVHLLFNISNVGDTLLTGAFLEEQC